MDATLAQVADALLAQPPVPEPFVCQGAIFEVAGEVPALNIP